MMVIAKNGQSEPSTAHKSEHDNNLAYPFNSKD